MVVSWKLVEKGVYLSKRAAMLCADDPSVSSDFGDLSLTLADSLQTFVIEFIQRECQCHYVTVLILPAFFQTYLSKDRVEFNFQINKIQSCHNYSILSDLGTSNLVTFTYFITLRAISSIFTSGKFDSVTNSSSNHPSPFLWPELKGRMKRKMSESRATITCEDIFGEYSSTSSTIYIQSFKLSNGNVLFLQQKTTKCVLPLDQGIICSFKGIYCKFHVRWILGMLELWTAAPINSVDEDGAGQSGG